MYSEYLCPFCISKNECVGPHIKEDDSEEFEAYSLNQYRLGYVAFLDDAIEALKNLQKKIV